METIADRLKARLINRAHMAVDIAVSEAQVVPVVEKAARHIEGIQRALHELTDLTGSVGGDLWTVFGVMAENRAVLRDLKYSLGHDATLMGNFVEVFMRKDHKLLAQSLREAEPDTRVKALATLSEMELNQWLADILDLKAQPDELDDD